MADYNSSYTGAQIDQAVGIGLALEGHGSNTSNPHGVTAAQVGLGNVDNTADSAKSVASAAALTTSAGDSNTPIYFSSGKPVACTSLDLNTTGSAATLTTARTIQTNLASASAVSFNGSADITPGVTGTLPVAYGGTGCTTIADTTYTTARYRASALVSSETTPSTNGTINWTYE